MILVFHIQNNAPLFQTNPHIGIRLVMHTPVGCDTHHLYCTATVKGKCPCTVTETRVCPVQSRAQLSIHRGMKDKAIRANWTTSDSSTLVYECCGSDVMQTLTHSTDDPLFRLTLMYVLRSQTHVLHQVNDRGYSDQSWQTSITNEVNNLTYCVFISFHWVGLMFR